MKATPEGPRRSPANIQVPGDSSHIAGDHPLLDLSLRATQSNICPQLHAVAFLGRHWLFLARKYSRLPAREIAPQAAQRPKIGPNPPEWNILRVTTME